MFKEKKKDEENDTEEVEQEESPEPTPLTLEVLAERHDNMERCLSKMAHYTGSNRVLDEFGIPRWEVTKESMQRKKG